MVYLLALLVGNVEKSFVAGIAVHFAVKVVGHFWLPDVLGGLLRHLQWKLLAVCLEYCMIL